MEDKKTTVVKTELTVGSRLGCMVSVMLDYTVGILNAILAGISLNRGSYFVALAAIVITITLGVFTAYTIKTSRWVDHKTYVYNDTIPPADKETA